MSTQTLRRSTRLAAKKPVAEQVEQPVAETKVKPSVTKKASSRRDLPPPLEKVYSDSDDDYPVYPAGVKIKDIEEPKSTSTKVDVSDPKSKVEIKKETIQVPEIKKEPVLAAEVKKEAVQLPEFKFYTFTGPGLPISNGKSPLTQMFQATEEHRKVCKVCKKSYLLEQIKNYMGTGLNISVSKAINMFTLIDKEIDFICSKDFTPDLKFMYVLHDKSVGLMNDIKRNLSTTPSLRQEINALLERVHQKTHLYIIKYEVNDPHYNKFLGQFINQYQ